jgi:hypothetical protein
LWVVKISHVVMLKSHTSLFPLPHPPLDALDIIGKPSTSKGALRVNSKCLNLQCMIYSMLNNFVIEISIKSKPKHFRNWGAILVLLENLLISRILCRDFIIFNLKCRRCWILNNICHCIFKKIQNSKGWLLQCVFGKHSKEFATFV